jgi:16S rRNA (adenine1518-N6/adenine1519-N6)-dimethyltransferase
MAMGLQFIRDTLSRHGLRLQRDRGQNFLVEEAMAERLASLAGVEAGNFVIEVGTGLGVLTRALAKRAAHVQTIEIDSGLVKALRADDLLPANVELVHADALEVDFESLIASRTEASVRVVANLPYSAASPLLRKLLDLRHVVADWSVMLQRELADRLVAEPGTKEYGSLTVLHALCTDVSKQLDLKPGCFFPAPKVESSFVRIWPRANTPLADGELLQVEKMVRAVFNQRRKTILNGLRGSGDREALLAALESVGIDPGVRAEKLEPERLLALARALEMGR